MENIEFIYQKLLYFKKLKVNLLPAYINSKPNDMLKHSLLTISFSVLSLILYVILGLSGVVRSEIEKYWLTIIPIYLLYFILVINILKENLPKNISFFWYILIGILFRVVLIPSEPFLSDDIYRYLWDGKISASGINPYQYAPLDSALKEYRDHVVHPQINFPEIATSYPPVSQFMFFINHWFGGSIFSWKILLLVMDLFVLVVIFKLVRLFKLSDTRVLIYFFNPLLIIETFSSGHLEIIGILFFWMAVLLFYKQKDNQSILLIGASIMTKFFPLISALPFLSKKLFRNFGFLLLVCSMLLLPFMFNGVIPLPGLFSYINRWEFNAGLYQLIILSMDVLEVKEFRWMAIDFSGHMESFYIGYAFYYKIIAFIIFIIFYIDRISKLKATLTYRSINYIQQSFLFTALFLLLTPTLHPWYLLWIIPLLIFIPNWSWLFFTFLIQASYFVLKDYALFGKWEESVWIILIQYIPFYGLLILEYLDKRKIKGWLSS